MTCGFSARDVKVHYTKTFSVRAEIVQYFIDVSRQPRILKRLEKFCNVFNGEYLNL